MDKEINRRQFICGLGASVAACALAGCGLKLPENSSETTSNSQETIQIDSSKLIVAEGKDPAALIKKGLNAIGGIGLFVKKGASVVIKPNYSVPRKPEEAATTDPKLVAALVKQCIAAGAKEVKVIDFPFLGGGICIKESGIKAAVEKAGGKAYDINLPKFFTEVDMGGTVLKKVMFSTDVLEADVLINVPKLKHHSVTEVTMGIKNMMGLVFDRGFFHRTNLIVAIAELAAYRKPDLTILDATRGIIDNGPSGPGTIHEWNQVVFGVDPVAVDAYGAKLFRVEPTSIAYLNEAVKLGIGEIDLQKLKIEKA